MIALPRTSRAAAAVTVMMVTCLVIASPAMAKSKAPVKLDGKVTNKGVGTAKNGTAQIEAHNYYFDKTLVKSEAGTVTVVEAAPAVCVVSP